MEGSAPSPGNAGVSSFQFTGTGGEYFKIWIVNLILSILTLGIYSAWAKVRTKRYFYGNTRLEDSGFEYHAKPLAILKGRILAVAILLIYIFAGQLFPIAGIVFAFLLLLAMPWIIWRSIQFNARMTSYRNVRFGFYGLLRDAYRYLLLLPLIPISLLVVAVAGFWLVNGPPQPQLLIFLVGAILLLTYLLTPYFQKAITAYYINHYRYGQGRFSADLHAGRYYLIYLGLIFWTLVIVAGLGLAAYLAVFYLGLNPGELMAGMRTGPSAMFSATMFVMMFVYLLLLVSLGLWFKAYMNTKVRNYVFNRAELDNVVQLEADMTVWRLFRFYLANTFLMLFTLGLAYPWIKVRIARITADATHAHIQGSLERYATQQQSRQSAVGDEVGEALDVGTDMDLAF